MQANFNALDSKALNSDGMQGVEYEVCEENGLLSLKAYWKEEKKRDLQSVFYAVDGAVFMCPTLADVMECRIKASIWYATRAMEGDKEEVKVVQGEREVLMLRACDDTIANGDW